MAPRVYPETTISSWPLTSTRPENGGKRGDRILDASEDVYTLANELVRRVPLPPKAAADSLHIAVATVNGMDYLLTWNCTHIANAALRATIEQVCRESGYEPPVICTPEELLKE